jgi:hypothetical protein
MDKIEIKLAERCDMKELAKVQTESWKSAFDVILSKEILQKHTNLEKCTNMLESVLIQI